MEPGTGPLRVCAQGTLRSLGFRKSGQAPDVEEGEGAGEMSQGERDLLSEFCSVHWAGS